MNFPKHILCLQGFHCFIICLLRHCSVLGSDCLFFCFLRHYTISSRVSLFQYLFVTSLLCSSLRLSLPLFLTFAILSLQGFHCFIIIICLLRHCSVLCFDCLFLCFLRHYTIYSRIVSSSVCFITIVSLRLPLPLFCYVSVLSFQGFHTSLLGSRLRLFHILFVTSLCFLLMVSIVSLSVCYVSLLSLQGFHCFIVCLLRHYSVLGFDCLFLCLLRHYLFLAISGFTLIRAP